MTEGASRTRGESWLIGSAHPPPTGAVVALDQFEEMRALATGCEVLRFHELLAGARREPKPTVVVVPPKWRGLRFAGFLEWVVTSFLATPGETEVTWILRKREGRNAIARFLGERGWEFDVVKEGEAFKHTGVAPLPGPRPEPRRFVAAVLGRELTFAADWGVFSPEHLDNGTRLLIDTASPLLRARGGGTLCDVGTGYGAVAIGLAVGVEGTSVVSSEVDYISAYLATLNAQANRVDMPVIVESDPSALPPSDVTTCEIPTHVQTEVTDLLLRGLVARAARGCVLVAVHRGLADRYARLFAEAGSVTDVVSEAETHVVLGSGPSA